MAIEGALAEPRTASYSFLGSLRGARQGWLLTLPLLAIMAIVVVFPTVFLVFVSLTNWMPTRGNWWTSPITGFGNFTQALSDARLHWALIRTGVFVIVAVGLETIIGLALALIAANALHGHRFFTVIFLLPMMVVPAVTGFIFFMLFQANGPVNAILSFLLPGNVNIPWLTSPTTALLIAILADIWQWTPMMFLILLAGVLTIPRNLLEAAYALGASPVYRLWHVVLPLLRPVLAVAVIIRSIEAIKVFDVIFVLTKGGPGTSTETIAIYIYQLAFREFRMAYVSAVSLIALAIVIALAFPLVRSLKAVEQS
jgi:multiple sugar transport system permease protein